MNRIRTKKRAYSPLATPEAKKELERLLEPSQAVYRDAMIKLGRLLGDHLNAKLGRKAFAVVTTPEDADFLTSGMLERLPAERVRLACYWTQRLPTSGNTSDVAAVIQEFVEPMPRKIESVIVAKSIISSGCIIRTNLEKFLTQTDPERIFIASPVMLDGADEILRSEFDSRIARRFDFVTLAVDSKRDAKTNTVVPGVGGWVNERLGLAKKSPRFSPELVKRRRSILAPAA